MAPIGDLCSMLSTRFEKEVKKGQIALQREKGFKVNYYLPLYTIVSGQRILDS